VAVEARAKLNLMLAVGPLRADGFHELLTVFHSISLADTLIAERQPRGFSLRTRSKVTRRRTHAARRGVAAIPAGPSNLVLRAARLVARALDLRGGARFTLVKRIPAGAGMGGGSADAAAVLSALPALYGTRLSRTERLALALELGSDVPFACIGGAALARGRGELLASISLERPFDAVIVMPRWRISTAQAYSKIDRGKYALTARGLTLRSAQILGREQLSATTLMRLGNTFERVLENRRLDFKSIGARLRRAGAGTIRMTGSGSAVFAIPVPGTPVQDVATRFTGNETVYVVRSARRGLRQQA
jgi:4-diphosphocytidyl-2-C-methyl-D-erythritol kinase